MTQPDVRRPVILTFIRCYLPGYKFGGPVRSIANLVEALGDEFEFRIVTSDRDALDEKTYSGVTVGEWVPVGKAFVYYVAPRQRGTAKWTQLLRDVRHDAVYLNSLLDPLFTTLPLLAQRWADPAGSRTVVIAPRGELSPSALALKWPKKKAFLAIAQATGLYRDVLWQASTADEASLIRARFGTNVRCRVACDLPTPPSSLEALPRRKNGVLQVVFLSRVARTKNLDFALRALALSPVPVQFDIWGVVEDRAYWRGCLDLMRMLPSSVVATYRGLAPPADVPTILASYDLLLLPTRGENYGHVIAEALSVGTPVLVSDRTPWRALQESGVGWSLPLHEGEANFAKAIGEAANKVRMEDTLWRKRVLDFARSKLSDEALVADNRALFRSAIGPQPNSCTVRGK